MRKDLREDILRAIAATEESHQKASAPAQLSKSANLAEWTYERLKNYIKEFEADLDDQHEIGAHLVSFGRDVTFHIDDIGYHGPDIITFHGKNDKGQVVQLIQHTSQLSVLLVAIDKQSDKPRRIGFLLDQRDNTEQEADDEGEDEDDA